MVSDGARKSGYIASIQIISYKGSCHHGYIMLLPPILSPSSKPTREDSPSSCSKPQSSMQLCGLHYVLLPLSGACLSLEELSAALVPCQHTVAQSSAETSLFFPLQSLSQCLPSKPCNKKKPHCGLES
ncbi:hypothetical protein LEMLEM_LOCUS249 [Lemmus lemmus]